MTPPAPPSASKSSGKASRILLVASSVTFTIAFTVGILWLLFWIVKNLALYLSAIPKELAASLIAGMATVLVATLTVAGGKYFERKKELDALYRDKKTQMYDEFLERFFQLFYSAGKNESDEDLSKYLQEFSRKLLLWSGPEVIESYLAWKSKAASGPIDAQTFFSIENLILAIRRDLRHSNKGIRKGLFARLFLKHDALFLLMAEKNPNFPIDELIELEKSLAAQADVSKPKQVDPSPSSIAPQ